MAKGALGFMGKDINHDVSAERQITDVTSAERHLA